MQQESSLPNEQQSPRHALGQGFADLLAAIEPETARAFRSQARTLVDRASAALARDANIAQLTGGQPADVLFGDQVGHVSFMGSTLHVRSALCLVEVLVWTAGRYAAQGFGPDLLPTQHRAWQSAIREVLVPQVPVDGLLALYDAMIARNDELLALARAPLPDVAVSPEFEQDARRFLDALLRPSETDAEAVLPDCGKAAGEIPVWWEQVITPALHKMGRLWYSGDITVAQEHMGTAIAQRVLSRCFPRLPDVPRRPETLCVAAAPNEFHDVGASMVRDTLQLAGFDVRYTGANTPADSIVALIRDGGARALLVSTTMPFNLFETRELVRVVHQTVPGMHVVVGGQAYRSDPGLWQHVGADAYVPRLSRVVDHLERQLTANAR